MLALVFAAGMALGAQVEIDLGPVPFVLSDAVVLLAGLLMGRWGAPLAVGLYLLAGGCGLPVFSDGGGWSYFAGPTGGYLLGFGLAAVVISQLVARLPRHWPGLALAALSGQASFFLLGVTGLALATDLSWLDAWQPGCFDFWFPALLKMLSTSFFAWLWYGLLAPSKNTPTR